MEEERKLNLLDSAIILALLSVVLYMGTYFGKSMGFTIYKIPHAFLTVDFNDLFITGEFLLLLTVSFIPAGIIMLLLNKMTNRNKSKRLQMVVLTFSTASFLTIILVGSVYTELEVYMIFFLFVALLVGIMIIFIIIIMIFLAFSRKGESQHANIPKTDYILLFYSKLKYIILGNVFFFVIVGTPNYQHFQIRRKTSYPALKVNNQINIVLEKYNDFLICRQINVKTNELADSVKLVKLSDSSPTTFFVYNGKLKF